ncbi:hypothetical protein BJ165DRAFT_852698 [Panaeolus papilionaceus]|nr:hypothetical protein BJ165DRAFT_852698 [Panaeolus papilionaceus]
MAVRASEASNSTKLLITGGNHTFQFNETSSTAGHAAFQRLFNHICDRAFHNSDECDEVKCHPGTRTAILQVLFDFANDSEHPFITWLNGPAGAGKTAIARSLAERCEEAGILAASFFFWRSDLERSDEKRLIPTLAYQLCLSIPLLRPFVEQSITNDPAIFSKTLTRQLSALILVPLQQIQASHSTFVPQCLPRLIIIDGLDECGGQNTDRAHRQGRALEILRQLASRQDIFSFRILVVSRTEAYIRRRFKEPSLQFLTRPLVINYSFGPEDDILVFVTHEFLWIVNHHPFGPYLPAGWPGNKVIRSIIDKSSGQFIYAATVMKFIRSELHRPDTRLALVQGAVEHKGVGPIMPFAPIDTLYRQIFCSAIDVSVALIVLTHHFTHRLAGFRRDSLDFSIVKKREPQPLDEIFGDPRVLVRHFGINPFVPLESIEKSLKLDPGVIPHTLSHFESLFTVSPSFTFEGKGYIEFHHASLTDFLFDKTRSQEWFIDLSVHSPTFAMADLAEFEDMGTGAASLF